MKLRIGIDARPLSYQLSGIGFYLKSILEEIQFLDTHNHYILISNSTIAFDSNSRSTSMIQGGVRKKLLSTLWMQTIGSLHAVQSNIDLFWGPRHHLPLLLPSRIKTVLTIHDIVHRRYPETMAWPNLAAERLLMRRSVRRADAIIADSKATAADIDAFYGLDADRVHVVYPGVPEVSLTNNTNSDELMKNRYPEKYFLFVGSLDPRKNFSRILKAFESADENLQNTHLLIVGGAGWKNKEFLSEIETHPLRPKIRLTGYVTRKELVHLYRNAQCLLFPSLYEGFGFPILEAMSCGTPVITSNVSSMPEVAGDAAVLVDPEDLSAIAAAMIRVVRDSDIRNRLIQEGFRQVKKFSWRDCALRMIDTFERVMAR